jgi:asparagine synthase (glutamine-hydrolysing)
MSVQFGRWNWEGRPLEAESVERVKAFLAPYGPDGTGFHTQGSTTIVYSAFHTTQESRFETQPYLSSKTVFTWDGRLDNRAELLHDLHRPPPLDAPDVAIAATAYEQWGPPAFARLLGDWAVSIWDPDERSLILAKDPIGTRPLFYFSDDRQIIWSSLLDPLIHFCPTRPALAEEYVAGWLALFPATHLTPYAGIYAVPPSSYLRFETTKRTVTRYWDFDPSKKIRYRSDAEYEDQFRTVFAEAVLRRLRSDRPILAELSGGMDSSSIVCMADALRAKVCTELAPVDTVSYFDDSEPHWDDGPYFTLVEEWRGRPGCHIDISGRKFFQLAPRGTLVAPGAAHAEGPLSEHLAAILTRQGNRVLLSGTAGDEVTGGVPTPIPELQDLLFRFRLKALAHALKAWALDKRKPWFHLLFEAIRGLLPVGVLGLSEFRKPAAWLTSRFIQRNREALLGYERALPMFPSLPSFGENLRALEALRRQLGCESLPKDPVYEIRYPYLDRSLLEFLYALPRDQLVRPGERRSLMRRALRGIVPPEILHRKRKAYVARAPRSAIEQEFLPFLSTNDLLASAELQIVDATEFRRALEQARDGQGVAMVALMRTIEIELWLRNSPLLEGRRLTDLHRTKA